MHTVISCNSMNTSCNCFLSSALQTYSHPKRSFLSTHHERYTIWSTLWWYNTIWATFPWQFHLYFILKEIPWDYSPWHVINIYFIICHNDPISLTLKISKLFPLVIVMLCIRFEDSKAIGLVNTLFTRFYLLNMLNLTIESLTFSP